MYPSPLRRIRVNGDSMRPTLEAGDRVVVVACAPPLRAPRGGDIVACRDPRDNERIIVKRVSEVTTGGALVVHGDNAVASTDSRHFGPVPRASVLGRVVYRYAPRERAGRVTTARARPST